MSVDVREIATPLCQAAKSNNLDAVTSALKSTEKPLPSVNELKGVFLHALGHPNFAMLTELAKHVLARRDLGPFSIIFNLSHALAVLDSNKDVLVDFIIFMLENYNQHFNREDREILTENFSDFLLTLDAPQLHRFLPVVASHIQKIYQQNVIESAFVGAFSNNQLQLVEILDEHFGKVFAPLYFEEILMSAACVNHFIWGIQFLLQKCIEAPSSKHYVPLQTHILRKLTSDDIEAALELLSLDKFSPTTVLFDEECVSQMMPHVLRLKDLRLVNGLKIYLVSVSQSERRFNKSRVFTNELMKKVCESEFIDAVEFFVEMGMGECLLENKEAIQSCLDKSMTQNDLSIMARWLKLKHFAGELFDSEIITKAFFKVIEKNEVAVCRNLLFLTMPETLKDPRTLEKVIFFTNRIASQLPLVAAVEAGRWEIVQMIVRKLGVLETSLAEAVGYGDVLFRAAMASQEQIVEELLTFNAPLPFFTEISRISHQNIRARLSRTMGERSLFNILEKVTSYDQSDDIVRQMIAICASGVEVDCHNIQGYTPLMILALWQNPSIAKPEEKLNFFNTLVNFLISRGASVSVLSKKLPDGKEPLVHAVINKNWPFLQALCTAVAKGKSHLYAKINEALAQNLAPNARVEVCEDYFPELLEQSSQFSHSSPQLGSSSVPSIQSSKPNFGFDPATLKMVGVSFIEDEFEAVEALILGLNGGSTTLCDPENLNRGLIVLDMKNNEKKIHPNVNHYLLSYIIQNQKKAFNQCNELFLSYLIVVQRLLSSRTLSYDCYQRSIPPELRSHFLDFVIADVSGTRIFYFAMRIGELFSTDSDLKTLMSVSENAWEYLSQIHLPKKDMLRVLNCAKDARHPFGRLFVSPPDVKVNGIIRYAFFPVFPVIDISKQAIIDQRIARVQTWSDTDDTDESFLQATWSSMMALKDSVWKM